MGSSNSKIRALAANARAKSTRCRSPPDSSFKRREAKAKASVSCSAATTAAGRAPSAGDAPGADRAPITDPTVRPPFHLAVPVDDLAQAAAFYGGVLGLPRGRSSDHWIDWNLGGHQVVTHLAPGPRPDRAHNPVDGHDVPVPHFGLVLPVADFQRLAGRLRAAGTTFVIEPYVRFAGEVGEQWTMFLYDPAGNPLEFKAFADLSQLFAH